MLCPFISNKLGDFYTSNNHFIYKLPFLNIFKTQPDSYYITEEYKQLYSDLTIITYSLVIDKNVDGSTDVYVTAVLYKTC